MADVTIRSPHLTDVGQLVTRLRAQDRAEIEAAGHDDITRAIMLSIRTSVMCWAAVVDGELACIFGCSPKRGLLFSDTGVPWMLGTAEVTRNARALMRLTPPYIAEMLRVYSHLMNFVHAENTVALNWLRRLKFEIEPAAPYGPHGALFHKFEMSRNV